VAPSPKLAVIRRDTESVDFFQGGEAHLSGGRDFMLTWLIAGFLAATPAEVNGAVVAQMRKQLQTGTLLFSRGDCLAIRVVTRSEFTHVGTVVVEAGEIVVYDTINGTGVRKQSLPQYIDYLAPSNLHVVQPTRPMTPDEAQRLAKHLRQHLGQPYGVQHYVTKRSARGMHCAEYATRALIAAGWMTAPDPARVSPGALYDAVLQSGRYVERGRFELRDSTPSLSLPPQETWCQSMWRETKECCSDCCRQLGRWFCLQSN
jgi:hypothetical protein